MTKTIKILTTLVLGLLLVTCKVNAQETIPDSLGRLTPVNSQFFITVHNGDTAIWHFKGYPYGYERLLRTSQLNNFVFKGTPFFANGFKAGTGSSLLSVDHNGNILLGGGAYYESTGTDGNSVALMYGDTFRAYVPSNGQQITLTPTQVTRIQAVNTGYKTDTAVFQGGLNAQLSAYGTVVQQNANSSNIAVNTANIAVNTANIATNTTAIANKANRVNTRVYILVGESNIAGEIPITEANSTDTVVNGHVNILNNTTLQIQPLHVGVNSTLGVNSSNSFFGPEVPILEATPVTDTVYIVKVGYAGATISALTGMLPTAYTRIDTALKQIRALGKVPVPYIIYSQGINDESSTDTTTWKNATLSYIRSLRNHIGYAPVLMTQFMTAYNSFNSTVVNLKNYDDWDYPIDATNTTTGTNGNQHWNKAGWNLLYSRMLYVINTTISGKDNYIKTEQDRAGLQNYLRVKSITFAPTFGSLSWGNTNTTQDNLLLYTNGTTTGSTGVGLNSLSANLQLFANSASGAGSINLGVGLDATTLSATNGGLSIDGANKVHVINQLLFGTSPTANIQGDYMLFYYGGSSSAATGAGLTNNSNSVLSLFGATEIRLAKGQDATTITDANSAAYVNSGNLFSVNGMGFTGVITAGSANVTGTALRLYDGGTSGTRTGFGLNNSQAHGVLYSYGPSGSLLFGVGNDETSMTTSNAAGYVNSSNSFIFNNTPTAPTAIFGTGNSSSLQLANLNYVYNNFAPSVSPTLTGTVALNAKLNVSTAANAASGVTTLVAGTVTVSNTSVTANSIIILTRKTATGTVGTYSYTVTAGSSFTITSSSSSDTSLIGYLIIN